MPTSLVVSRPVCHELTSPAKLLLGREDAKATSADGAWHEDIAMHGGHLHPCSLGQGHRGCPVGRDLAAHCAALVPGVASLVTKLLG